MFKEGVSILFRLKLAEIFSQGKISESGGNSWGDLWDDPRGVSGCDSGTGTSVPVVLVVAVVLVSPSSVVTEVCDGFSVESHWGINLLSRQSFFFLQKALECVRRESRRGGL